MTMTKTLESDVVDVGGLLRQHETSVGEAARQRFADNLRAYRQGVARMAANEGKLPADEADHLLTVCRDLGIPPGRLNTDVVVMIRFSRLTAEVDAVLERASQQASVVATIRAELDAEERSFCAVRVECEGKLKTAEARLNEVQRRHDAAANVRQEPVHQQQAAMVELRNQSPYLFDDIDADGLRRFVAP